MKKTLTIHHNAEKRRYFFSTDHCQGVGKSYYESFVPITVTLPLAVVPRPSLPSGLVKTKADYVRVFCKGDTEIENPEAGYQA